jgi:predicted secreted protein
MKDATNWARQLHDRRGKRVIFLAHCLLNENVRYLGGACQGGAIREILDQCLELEIGVVQLPCPEQHAWGGVLKRRLLSFYGSVGSVRYRVGCALLRVMLWYTRRIYRRLARETAAQIADYEKCGVTVLGIVGVDASPSCGVFRTLDIEAALSRIARLEGNAATALDMNRIVRSTVTPGQGLYIRLLCEELAQRGLRVPLTAHDLIDELDGKSSSVDVRGLLPTSHAG